MTIYTTDIFLKYLRKEVLKMRVNNPINTVQKYYLDNSNPKKKGPRANPADSIFAGLVGNAAKTTSSNTDQISLGSDWLAGITNEGKNSTGDKQLTEAQRKYLSQKYDVTDMPASQRQSLLGELTNMGVLSFDDYKRSHLRPVPPEGVILGGVYNSSTGKIEGRVYNPSADWPTRDILAHYKTIAHQETEDYDYIYQTTGKKQNNFKEFSASHSRVADLLQTLVRTK